MFSFLARQNAKAVFEVRHKCKALEKPFRRLGGMLGDEQGATSDPPGTVPQVNRKSWLEAADELKKRAESEGWDADEYFGADDVLREHFEHWLPKISTYSVIILLHSLVETQLHDYARRLRRERDLVLELRDIHGRGFEQAKTYITKVARLDIATDLGWHELSNLQEIRNIIVHRRGLEGDSREQQEVVRRLLKAYPQDLSLRAPQALGLLNTNSQELVATFRLCSHFLKEIEAFFARLCQAAGFQTTGLKW